MPGCHTSDAIVPVIKSDETTKRLFEMMVMKDFSHVAALAIGSLAMHKPYLERQTHTIVACGFDNLKIHARGEGPTATAAARTLDIFAESGVQNIVDALKMRSDVSLQWAKGMQGEMASAADVGAAHTPSVSIAGCAAKDVLFASDAAEDVPVAMDPDASDAAKDVPVAMDPDASAAAEGVPVAMDPDVWAEMDTKLRKDFLKVASRKKNQWPQDEYFKLVYSMEQVVRDKTLRPTRTRRGAT